MYQYSSAFLIYEMVGYDRLPDLRYYYADI